MAETIAGKMEANKRKTAVIAAMALSVPLFFLASPGPAVESSSGSDFNNADVMFMNMMIIHHDQAIEMAELAPNRTDNGEILALSRNISESQRAENSQMAEWLEELGYQRPRNGHRMAGMATEEEMEKLRESKGREFDLLFSELMIAHHRGGIRMAQTFIERGHNPELIEMEKNMVKTQQAEIERMLEWRKGWNTTE